MFFGKDNKKEMESFDQDKFLEGIKKDMTNRAAIAAKQESTINKLIEALEAERKETKALRVLYEKRMKMDDEIIDKFIVMLEKRKQ